MKHIHAELMRQYAEDAMETDKPWERWQFSAEGEPWEDIDYMNPSWHPEWQYRRKPRTIRIVEQSPAPTDAPETLRDRFAMAALTGMLANSAVRQDSSKPTAEAAYIFADAMMEARKK